MTTYANPTRDAITPAQKRFIIALVEKKFPHSEDHRNFFYKIIPNLTKAEASIEIKKLLTHSGPRRKIL